MYNPLHTFHRLRRSVTRILFSPDASSDSSRDQAAATPDSIRAFPPVTIEFLMSPAYKELMNRHLPYDLSYDLHEAQNDTSSYRFRHHQQGRRLGVFRWRGIQENLDLILDRISGTGKVIVDFGGAAMPLALGSQVVDRMETDVFGNSVPYHSLLQLPEKADVIFSSHTLEHIPNLDEVLAEISTALKPHGILILLVPAFSCVDWRAGVHKNPSHNDHCWTFGLAETVVPPDMMKYLPIDTKLSQFFRFISAKYCGDDSIFLLASQEPLNLKEETTP